MGFRPVDALEPLRLAGSAIGGLHPLRAFTEPSFDVADAEGVVFGVGGDEAAVRMGNRIAGALRAGVVEIDDASRPLYHLAASLAAGGVVTMLAVADHIASRADLPAASEAARW